MCQPPERTGLKDPRGLAFDNRKGEPPALVAHDSEGKVYTVRYEAVSAMLLHTAMENDSSLKPMIC
jgi:hypothetical protein